VKKKVLLKGPLLTRSGYGEQARFALRSLRSREDLFEVFIQPLQWGKTSWASEMDEERIWIDQTIEKTIGYIQQGGQFDLSVQVTIPNEFQRLAPINIGYTAGIETTKVAHQWIEKANEMDKIIVVSSHSKQVFENTEYQAQNTQTGEQVTLRTQTPVEFVNYPVKTFGNLPELNLGLSTSFNFLTVAQFGPRKNLLNTIKWFIEEFRNEDVGLVIKSNIAKNCLMDRNRLQADLTNFLRQQGERQCKVYLLHGDMTDAEMHSLYQHSDIHAFVSLPHGEGFGLPLFEAAYSGLPVVTVGWSGQLDFLVDAKGQEQFYNVAFDLQPVQKEVVWDGVITGDSMWAYAREGSAKEQMRACFESNTKRDDYAQQLNERFSEQAMYRQFASHIYEDKTENISVSQIPKISLITSVFNAKDFVDQLIEDVTRQTIFESHCEWVILNVNKPGDDYEEKAFLELKKKFPNNIVYKRLDEDPGIYAVWNQAIKMSSGDFLTNVNCDDRRSPNAFEIQAKNLVAHEDVDLIYNDSYVVREPNVLFEDVGAIPERYNFENFSKEAMLRGNLPHNNPMWKKSLHETFGLFDEKYKSAGDWEMWLRATFGGAKFKKCSNILGVYYMNPTGISTNPENNSWKREEEKEVFAKYLEFLNNE
jgi:glycosyltransferase involved in cell wall biosynthesis